MTATLLQCKPHDLFVSYRCNANKFGPRLIFFSCRRSSVLLLVQAAAQTSYRVLDARTTILTPKEVVRDLPRFRSIDIIVYQSSFPHYPLANN